MNLRPTVGRVVHFHEHEDGPPRAAIVTELVEPANGTITVIVFPPGEAPRPMVFVNPRRPGRAGPHWRWPPRETEPAPMPVAADYDEAKASALVDALISAAQRASAPQDEVGTTFRQAKEAELGRDRTLREARRVVVEAILGKR